MSEMVFSWAENANGKMVHVDSVPQGLSCNCMCPCCHERLQARHGEIRAHGFAHHSMERGANLKICYMVIMYKLAEQIIQQVKKIHAPSYYGIFRATDIVFSEVLVDDRYERIDKQPDVIGITTEGEQYLIEFTFDYKVQHKEKIDYRNLNCIEMDLSSQTLDTLHNFILHSDENKRWLNNQSYFEQIEKVYSEHGKQVKLTSEKDCLKCELDKDCCGIRLKNSHTPITLENSGSLYRVCKIEEFETKKRLLEAKHTKFSGWNDFYEEERKYFFGINRTAERDNLVQNTSRVTESRNKVSDQEELELAETTKIDSEDRTCFMCRCNLDWMCKNNDGYAHCGSYMSMRVPKNTPPDTAKTCKGFRVKL